MVSFDKSRPRNLAGFTFSTNGNKQVALTGCQLKQQVFIGFFVLVYDLLNCVVNITDNDVVSCCKELIEHLLQIPCRK